MADVIVSIDIETCSEDDLTAVGASAYIEHSSTECVCLAFKQVGEPNNPELWRRGEQPPPRLMHYVRTGAVFSGWNVMMFDRLGWARLLVGPHGFEPIPDDNWKDSMHLAAHANLPRDLAGCARAVGMPFTEDLKDKARIRRITNKVKTPVMSLEDFDWLCNRCVQDVAMEEGVYLRLPPWPEIEPWRRLPAIDRRVNDKGALIDVDLIRGMARAAQAETHRMNGLLGKITDDAVSATSQVERLKLWLVQNGVVLPSTTEPTEDGDEEDEDDEASTSNSKKSPWKLRKSDIADILARNDVPEKCREALALRAEAGKASVRKLHRMLGFATSDSRLHGIIKLGGAQQTMRWSSGGPQLHNMVRDSFGNIDEIAEVNSLDLKKADHKKFAQYLQQVSLTTAIQVGRTGDAELIRMLYERRVKDAQGRSSMAGVLTWISRMSRRTIAAERGKVFLNGDFSSAQARITVWLAQQLNMIQAYYNNEDTYKVAAAGIYHTTIELITKMQRQAGKVSILAGGFGGGPKALMAMAYNYGMLLTLQEATEIIKLWRAANQQTEEMWYATDDAAANAVLNPGREYHVPPCGLVSYFMLDNALCCRLPSGRLLRYWAPRLTQEYWPGGKPKDRLSLSALVVKGGYVFRNSIYHTILCNNYVQAIEADMLAVTLDNLEQAGLPASLHVHDNAASEVLEDHASDFLPTFKQCMLAQPGWTYGLPIGCDIEISARFG